MKPVLVFSVAQKGATVLCTDHARRQRHLMFTNKVVGETPNRAEEAVVKRYLGEHKYVSVPTSHSEQRREQIRRDREYMTPDAIRIRLANKTEMAISRILDELYNYNPVPGFTHSIHNNEMVAHAK